MPIQIATSRDDHCTYYVNLSYLRSAVNRKDVRLVGEPFIYDPKDIEFNKSRSYDFVRSAGKEVREAFVDQLITVLPGFQKQDKQEVRGSINYFFNYHQHKDALEQDGEERKESIKMLIFQDGSENPNTQPYVAHVSLMSVFKKTCPRSFTVSFKMSCQRFSYFAVREHNFDAFLKALENLHIAPDTPKDLKPPEDINSDQASQQIKKEKVEGAVDD